MKRPGIGINPVKEVAEAVDRYNRVFMVDSVSGLRRSPDIAGNKLYTVVFCGGR